MRIRRLLVALLVLWGFVVATPVAASEDHLVGSAPAAGEVLLKTPAHVGLELTPGTEVGEVAVTDPTGTDWAVGDPVQDGEKVTVTLDSAPPAGTYGVQWRAVTGDGDVVSGEVGFIIAPPELATPRLAQPDAADIEPASRSTEPGLPPWPRTVIVSVLGVVVSVVVMPRVIRWRVHRRRAADPVEQALRASGGFEVHRHE